MLPHYRSTSDEPQSSPSNEIPRHDRATVGADVPTFPNEKEAASRVAAEAQLSLKQIDDALLEIRAFNLSRTKKELACELSGFALMEANLETLRNKILELQEWHRQKHEHIANEGEKKLLLAEISILLITPYIHRLLTTEDRKHPGGVFDTADSEERLSYERMLLKELNFQKIDPVYYTRYDGVCLAALMRAVTRDINHALPSFRCCFGGRSRVSFWHRGHAKVLASKFFGAITCLEMILTLGAQEDDDLILEKAVGQRSPLEVDGVVEKCLLYDRRSAERNLRYFTSMILLANAVVSSGYHKRFLVARLAAYAWTGMRLVLPWNMAEGELKGEVCYTGTKAEVISKLHFARFVWNLPETPLVKNFYKLGLPRVRVDHEFYIPPQRNNEARLEGGLDPVFARVVSNRAASRLPKTTSVRRAKAFDWDSNGWSPIQASSPSSPLMEPLLVSTPTSPQNKDLPYSDVLLVCFHGGGFIALSSFSHENYYRIWAQDLPGITILASDYRLAPDFQFPYAFNDAYRTYKYAVEMCESELGFRPRKVLVAGDSAGGNLTAAITVRAIEENFKVPDGILLIYPVVDMRRMFSPSLMWSVNDRIVPFVFLECCLSAYLGDPDVAKERAKDPRCSPALAAESVLKKMPPTRIVVGDCDPLMDQSIRFSNHLALLGVDVRCKIFQAMPHGFCSFVWPIVGVPEVKLCIDSCTELLKELASNNEISLQF